MKHILAALLCVTLLGAHAAPEKKHEYTAEEQASIDKQYQKAMKYWNNETLRDDAQKMMTLSEAFVHDYAFIQPIVKFHEYNSKAYRAMHLKINKMNDLANAHITQGDDCGPFAGCFFRPCFMLAGNAMSLKLSIDDYLSSKSVEHRDDYAAKSWIHDRKEFDQNRDACRIAAFHEPKKSDFEPETNMVTL